MTNRKVIPIGFWGLALSLVVSTASFGDPSLAATPAHAHAKIPATGGVGLQPATSANAEAFLRDFNAILDANAEACQRMNNARCQELSAKAKTQLQAMTPDEIATFFGDQGIPDLSEGVDAAKKMSSQLTPQSQALVTPFSAGFPDAPPILSDCNNIVHDSSATLGFLIAAQIARTVLAAAEFICEQDVLGENVALPCVAFAVAVDSLEIPLGLAEFCGGEEDSALLQGSYDRLAHIHDDISAVSSSISSTTTTLATAISTAQSAIITNDNSNKTTILNTDNANTATLSTAVSIAQTSIVNNDNSNKTAIINNDNANTTTLSTAVSNAQTSINNTVSNAQTSINNTSNANTGVLQDLLLRTQIEADLAAIDSATPVALYLTPTANGGYLDLVKTIVTQTLANIQAAGGSIGNAQTYLTQANAQKAAGQFKDAYKSYRKAYKAAAS